MALQGSASPAQQDYLRILATGMSYVAEIGFNEGVSAQALLSANPVLRLVSFEIARHYDVDAAKLRIDCIFPGRHELVAGDSRETVPLWAGAHPYQMLDMVFVDGGHEPEVVKADLANSVRLLRPGGLLVCDDLTPWKPWGAGPVQAWEELTAAGGVVQVDLRLDGEWVAEIPQDGAPDARVWAPGMVW